MPRVDWPLLEPVLRHPDSELEIVYAFRDGDGQPAFWAAEETGAGAWAEAATFLSGDVRDPILLYERATGISMAGREVLGNGGRHPGETQ